MKNIIIVFLVLLSFYGFSQEVHEDGQYQEYRENGILERDGFYKNNKRVGIWKDYHENGKIYKIYSYSDDGELTGLEKHYSEDGKLTRETNPDEQGNLIRKLYSENANLFAKYNVVPSKNRQWFFKQGLYEEYFENGNLKVKCTYINDVINGLWWTYYDIGEKEWQVEYKDGYRQGSYKKFYQNGVLRVEGTNFEDRKNGNEKQFDENGNLVLEGKYQNGQLHGTWSYYDTNGNVIKSKYNKGELLKGDTSITLNEIEIPDGALERVPIYPGCDLPSNQMRRECMSEEMSSFVLQRFNTTFAGELGLTGKQTIYVIFKIDEFGKITDIRARAKHKALEAEAIRVIALLPKMTPGFKRGKAIKVPYSLPIIFQIKDSSKKKS